MITVEAAALSAAMKHAASVVESSQTIPILANVRLVARDGALELTTSDLDCEYRQAIEAEVETAMAVTVDARRLFALAAAAEKKAQLRVEIDGSRVLIKSGRSRWDLPALPATDFPSIPAEGMDAEIELAGPALAAALVRVQWSISTEITRYYLCGALLHAEGGKAALASTNGNTLMRVVLEADAPEDAPDCILGSKFTRLLAALCGDAGKVTLRWSRTKVRATVGAVELTAKAIDGTFPDYRRVIPPLDAEPVALDPASLRGALRRVQLVATEKTRAIKLEREADKIVLGVTSPDGGTAREELPASGPEGHTTGFNAMFLDRMVEAIGGDTIAMHQADAGAPARFERVVPDGALCVVMPMRV